MGFNALIHSHRPDLIDYGALEPADHIENLNNAFNVAQRELGIPRLLDAEDIDTNKPDEKSVMTYVASYYHTFARMKNEMKQGRRIANIVAQMMDADRQKYMYERLTSKLLEWIQAKTAELQDHCFPNSLEGIQGELLKFKEYRTVEKPPKYKERSDIEALLFDIQTKQKALGRPLYVPPEGKMAHDIQRAWEQLEEAEHAREVALREELLRQKKLETWRAASTARVPCVRATSVKWCRCSPTPAMGATSRRLRRLSRSTKPSVPTFWQGRRGFRT